jgi:tetratricopeptide (TPR) repeat protein
MIIREKFVPNLIALTVLMFSACYVVTADQCDIAAGEMTGFHSTPPSGGLGIALFSAIPFILDMNDKLNITNQIYSRAWYYKAADSYDHGKYEKALNEINKAIDTYDRHSTSWTLKGCTLYMLGRCTEAISSCDTALKMNPDNARAWHTKGIALYCAGRFKEAVRSCNRALEIDPNDAKAWEYRILACRSLCGDCCSDCAGVPGNSNIGGPNIGIIDFITENGWNISLGAYLNCTIAIANYGAIDGIASISLMGDNSRVLKSFDVIVPKKSISRIPVILDTTIDDKQITCKIVRVRTI